MIQYASPSALTAVKTKRVQRAERTNPANLIGVVLNQVDAKSERYYSGKYYATYYGEGD